MITSTIVAGGIQKATFENSVQLDFLRIKELPQIFAFETALNNRIIYSSSIPNVS